MVLVCFATVRVKRGPRNTIVRSALFFFLVIENGLRPKKTAGSGNRQREMVAFFGQIVQNPIDATGEILPGIAKAGSAQQAPPMLCFGKAS